MAFTLTIEFGGTVLLVRRKRPTPLLYALVPLDASMHHIPVIISDDGQEMALLGDWDVSAALRGSDGTSDPDPDKRILRISQCTGGPVNPIFQNNDWLSPGVFGVLAARVVLPPPIRFIPRTGCADVTYDVRSAQGVVRREIRDVVGIASVQYEFLKPVKIGPFHADPDRDRQVTIANIPANPAARVPKPRPAGFPLDHTRIYQQLLVNPANVVPTLAKAYIPGDDPCGLLKRGEASLGFRDSGVRFVDPVQCTIALGCNKDGFDPDCPDS